MSTTTTLPVHSKTGNKEIHDNIQKVLDGATADPQQIPGVVFAAIDRKGELITFNASGHRGLESKQPMDEDTIFWIASFTKLIAAIVCMQLVEKGSVKLDDAEHLYKYCPELKTVKVLQEDGSLVDRKKDITLRLLLTHTAGFGYDFFNQTLLDHYRPVGLSVIDGVKEDILRQPLSNQPGEKWEYGINIDWAGIYCERATGQGLNDLIQQGVVEPLGLQSTTMFPTEKMQKNLASLHQRYTGSPQLHVTDHLGLVKNAIRPGAAKMEGTLHSGGAGLFSKPTEYLQVLAVLLNDGVSPKTNKRILKAETVEEMFTNQLPHLKDYAKVDIKPSKPLLSNPIPDLSLNAGPQGWGLSLQLVEDAIPGGRSGGSGNWAGIANCYYFVDRKKGVAAVINSQILPFFDMNVVGAFMQCEGALYAGLE